MKNNTSQHSSTHDDQAERPVSGILDIVGNTATLRVDGYLPGDNDLHVAPRLIRENHLRRGDFVTGLARPPQRDAQSVERDAQPDQRVTSSTERDAQSVRRDARSARANGQSSRHGAKLDPLLRVETVNGQTPEHAGKRPVFENLVPLYPNQRLRLETEPHELTTRVTDLVMPIGKGQRALVVAPPKAGKTSVLQAIAHGIAKNHPECELMLVLVGERPEEVTDLARTVPADVAAATFDRSPGDQIALAELAVERAKRLAETGRDVVVLLDSLTRLARAYNNAAPTSGRVLSGGVDAAALASPKRFLGAARNFENGGSLTIVATTLVETGSLADTVIFEEYKGTGNAELKLDRATAARRVFPAVDIAQSSTRKDELLLTPAELAATHHLRRTLAAVDGNHATELLLEGLRQSKSNAEFLTQFPRN
ncbi:transcription termination factor Rho [Nocardia amikacinitolerans]|uniref:transcription termination factor Rho n=1 Tax=Nocardia amikacinitolerans TaxID=756689 RepID=UPI0020A26411|nr:transcription termination factor Rho [Nocardia amikacinitolerans]MCP2297115.1 transcription termination factor Rho [Nocardia amikacinitolerans]